MPELKKIDYRQLAGEAQQPQAAPPGADRAEIPAQYQKVSWFASLANRWALMDTKTKLEVFIFLAVIVVIAGVLVFYFVSAKRPEFQAPASYSRPAIE